MSKYDEWTSKGRSPKAARAILEEVASALPAWDAPIEEWEAFARARGYGNGEKEPTKS